MKKLMYTMAIVGTVVAFVFSCALQVHVDEVQLVANVLEHRKDSNRQLVFLSMPVEEGRKVQTSFDPEAVLQDVVSSHIFPEIEDSTPSPLPVVESPVYCPFTQTDTDFIIDFTRKGTVTLAELSLVANQSTEDAQKSSGPVLLDIGVYTVHLASVTEAGLLETETERSFEQQWYLELYDEKDAVVFTTHATRDTSSDEVGIVVELVEQGVVLKNTVSKARALHTAYPDSEPQTVTPLCARLSLEEVLPDENLAIHDEVGEGEHRLFTASVFLQNTDSTSHDYTFLFTLGAILTLLCSMVVLVVSPFGQKS